MQRNRESTAPTRKKSNFWRYPGNRQTMLLLRRGREKKGNGRESLAESPPLPFPFDLQLKISLLRIYPNALIRNRFPRCFYLVGTACESCAMHEYRLPTPTAPRDRMDCWNALPSVSGIVHCYRPSAMLHNVAVCCERTFWAFFAIFPWAGSSAEKLWRGVDRSV